MWSAQRNSTEAQASAIAGFEQDFYAGQLSGPAYVMRLFALAKDFKSYAYVGAFLALDRAVNERTGLQIDGIQQNLRTVVAKSTEMQLVFLEALAQATFYHPNHFELAMAWYDSDQLPVRKKVLEVLSGQSELSRHWTGEKLNREKANEVAFQLFADMLQSRDGVLSRLSASVLVRMPFTRMKGSGRKSVAEQLLSGYVSTENRHLASATLDYLAKVTGPSEELPLQISRLLRHPDLEYRHQALLASARILADEKKLERLIEVQLAHLKELFVDPEDAQLQAAVGRITAAYKEVRARFKQSQCDGVMAVADL